MPHLITEKCVGCTICELKCPTKAITGTKKGMYYIDPKLCIDCRVCGVWCPYDAIVDETYELIPHAKAAEIPRAEVIEELCTGCDICVAVCPFDCISLESTSHNSFTGVAVVDEKKCVSCRLCEVVCIKEAIIVPNPLTNLTSGTFSLVGGTMGPANAGHAVAKW